MSSDEPALRVRTFVQLADYAPGETYGPRVLPDYELVWLLAGATSWRTRTFDTRGRRLTDETHLLRPGTLALARYRSREEYAWSPDTTSRHAYVHFTLDHAGRLGDPALWPSVRSTAGLPVLEGLCSYLIDLAVLRTEWARSRSDELVRLLLELFVTGPVRPESHDLPDGLLRMSRFVAEVWERDGMRIVGVGELAGAAAVSAGYLHQLFRERFTVGPSRALELLRLARAATALQRSNATLGQVAGATGFANPYHFSRRFSSTYGRPPGAFRRDADLVDPLWPVREAGLQPLAQVVLGRWAPAS